MQDTRKERKVRKIEAIALSDHEDERYFIDTIAVLAAEGTAHVRYLGGMAEGLKCTFVVSNLPISPRQAMKAAHDEEIESARDLLHIIGDPFATWQSSKLSIAEFQRLAKEEGIVLKRDWVQVGEQEAQKRAAENAQKEVVRLEAEHEKLSNDLALARTHVQRLEVPRISALHSN